MTAEFTREGLAQLGKLAHESAFAVETQHFAVRMVQQMLTEAMPWYWLRRAADFAAVGTPAADEIAEACRERAALLRRYPDPVVEQMHDDVAALVAGADAEAVAA